MRTELIGALLPLACATALASMCSNSAYAQAQSANTAVAAQQFDIPAGNLADALTQFGLQSGLQISFPRELAAKQKVKAVKGRYTPAEALNRLLRNGGFEHEFLNGSTVVVKEKPKSKPAPKKSSSVAEGQDSVATTDLETINVTATGTNIRGTQQKFSPVITATREDLDLAGYASPADYLQQLPQNFGGGGSATPDRSARGATGSGFASVNLRGLGNEANLVLIDGRRIAASGVRGDAVDISMIPSAAIERIDVLLDGASAIYGADAVSGVVNILTRRNYVGGESKIRVGTKSGDAADYRLSQAWGWADDTRRLLAAYEYSYEQALDKSDRSYTSNLDGPNDILPESRKNGIFVSSGLSFDSGAEIYFDVLASQRRSRSDTYSGIYLINKSKSKSISALLGLQVPISEAWTLDVSSSLSKSDSRSAEHIAEFHPTIGRIESQSEESVFSVDAKVDGKLFDARYGKMYGVLGAQWRSESHSGFNDTFGVDGEPLGYVQMAANTSRNVKSIFGELLFLANNGLSADLAARFDSYGDVGSSFNPKLGLSWAVNDALSLRAGYGTSFKAPRLQLLVDNVSSLEIVDLIDPASPTGRSVAAYISGDRRDLAPEESTSKTIGLDYSPTWAPHLVARLGYYDIDYQRRIDTPRLDLNWATGLVRSWPLPLDRTITLEQILAWRSGLAFGDYNHTINPEGSNSSIEDVTVLLDGRPRNTAGSRQRGFDLDVSNKWIFDGSSIHFRLTANYILQAEDRFSPLTVPVKKYGLIFLQPRLKARSAVTWSEGGQSLSFFSNFAGSNVDNRFDDRRVVVSSWLTHDLTYQRLLGESDAGSPMGKSKIIISVQNIFDRDPPEIVPSYMRTGGAEFSYVSYDSANADPYGRWISFQYVKEW